MRSEIVTDWLARSEWAKWRRDAMTGDASARRYERLHGPAGISAILMDAPPGACGSQARFVEIGNHLRDHGLAAPEIFEWDEALGLMVLEDLGSDDFARHLRSHPTAELPLYEAAIDTLLHIGSVPALAELSRMTPQVGADMIELAFEWAAVDRSDALANDIKAQINALLQDVSPEPTFLSLRDFHAENLIWRPDQTGISRVGLLDFQDGFVTHAAYDLASLLRDARRDVSPELVDPLINRMNPSEDFRAAFHVMALQRNLRILGIFERLASQDRKAYYRTLAPRVWAHIQTDLRTPYLSGIAPLVRRAFDPKGTPK